jgi:hypothetical protein
MQLPMWQKIIPKLSKVSFFLPSRQIIFEIILNPGTIKIFTCG